MGGCEDDTVKHKTSIKWANNVPMGMGGWQTWTQAVLCSSGDMEMPHMNITHALKGSFNVFLWGCAGATPEHNTGTKGKV